MKKVLFIPLLLFLVSLLIFGSIFLFNSGYLLKGRASVKLSVFSPENSYIFTTPLQAKADGKEKIRITVFLLDNRGLGVPNQKVELGFYKSLNIQPIQPITDQTGKAVFDISSTEAGDFYLEVKASGRKLPQKAHLKFIP